MMLEASQHKENSFLTLTYEDAPEEGVILKDFQDFLKRFRRKIEPIKVRYFGVGEYGDVSFRPHYHLALFGFGGCEFGKSRYARYRGNCCFNCDLVRDSWNSGHIYFGRLTVHSAQYVAGYTAKGLTKKDDFNKGVLGDKNPEFARMSRRPGLGTGALEDIAASLLENGYIEKMEDVPNLLLHGEKKMPLDRFSKQKLRKFVGRDERTPEHLLPNPTLREFRLEREKANAKAQQVVGRENRKPKRTL